MIALGLVGALLVASPSVRVTIDRAYLPTGSGDGAPIAHLAVRGTKEVEVSLYEVGHAAQVLLGLPALPDNPVATRRRLGSEVATPEEGPLEPPPLAAAWSDLRNRARAGYVGLWRSLRPPARDLLKEILGIGRPLGGSLLAAPTAPESRVRRGESLLRSWRLPIGEVGWNYTDLDLGPLPTGIYRVEALAGTSSARALLTVSRLSLVLARNSEGTSVLATDSVDGRPLPGVELLTRTTAAGEKGHPVSLGRTGPGGLWSTRAQLDGTVVGRGEGQLARVTLTPPRVELPERAAAAVLFDRRAYRPGDTVKIWALLRTREAGSWKIPEADEAQLQLLDRRGTTLFEQPVEVSALGVVSHDLELPMGLVPGWYSIAVAWAGERKGGEILVQRQAPAEIAARWEAPDWSSPSSPLDVAVLVTDRLGKPEPGVEVHWTAEARAVGPVAEVSTGPSEIIGEGVGVSRQDGRVPIRLPPAQGEGIVALHAEAEDSAGRSAIVDRELRRIHVPAILDLTPDRRVIRPGHAPSVTLEGRTLEGQPWRGRVDVHVLGVHNSAGGEAVRTAVLQRVVELDVHGRAALTLPAASPGYLEIRASLPDSGEPLARASIFVTESGGDIPTTPDRLELILDRPEYGKGDDVRLLVLSPFESGTVLLGLDPSGGPPDALVAIHGYSSVVHLKLSSTASAARLTAAALVGGTLYRASIPVPVPERAAPLTLRLTPNGALHAGQRAVFSLGAFDGEGRGIPALLEVAAATNPPASPPIAQLFLPPTPDAAALFSSTGAVDSALDAAPTIAARRGLQPFGPAQLGEVAWEREVSASQVARVAADDLGHGAVAVHIPADAERLYVSARGVGGPDLFAERSWVLPVLPSPRTVLDAPAWVRARDEFVVTANALEAGSVGCGVNLEAAGATLGASTCSPQAGRAERVVAGVGPDLDLAATLPSLKLSTHRTVRVVAPGSAPTVSTAWELARALASGLAGSAESTDPAELDCAAVRALGALRVANPRWDPNADPGGREVAGAVARVAQEENPAGGIGAPDGELRRDLAALRGLDALRDSGTPVDSGLLLRLQRRVEVLVERVADAQERDTFEGLLRQLLEPEGSDARSSPARHPLRAVADAAEIEEGTLDEISVWLGGHRANAEAGQALAHRLVDLAPEADPLDAAEIAASLAGLGTQQGLELAASPPVVRRYLQIVRPPWTEELLAADEEPAESTHRAAAGAIPLGAELDVSLVAPVSSSTHFACLRDFPPVGLAPLGAPEVSQSGLLLCGPTNHDRLEVSYQLRAVRAGRFQSPAAGLGVAAPPGPVQWVEVAP